ncbi:SseB family protein [Janibacter sp. G349]|uniref:SseB family protein n=1 Tax=unclassified Janibacter TaxID=2649294 RepID=UPI0020CC67B3|nr:SseB family protein [Janibacter sp. CX7]UTT64905.1 SseB family protein [Janibacter sp. CX7]
MTGAGPESLPGGSDSAGVPWQGRELPTGGFAGDTGEADPALRRALTSAGEAEVVEHLAAARLFVPVKAVATDTAEGEHGVVSDKEADMAVVLLEHPDGRTALPVFSSIADMTAFDTSARPVPVEAARAAQAAVGEQADLMVLDCASEHAFEVRASMVWALAQQRAWLPAHEDPFVADSVARVVARHDEVTDHDLAAGVPDGQGVLQVRLTLVPGLDEEGVRALVTAIAEALATDGELRARVDGLSFTVV